jgi:16S rRNA G966 N2-methylase RsmD
MRQKRTPNSLSDEQKKILDSMASEKLTFVAPQRKTLSLQPVSIVAAEVLSATTATDLISKELALDDPARYIGRHGYMYIGNEDWKALLERFSAPDQRGKLIQLLDDVVTKFKLEPPTREIKRDEAIQAFRDIKALPEGHLLSHHITESRFPYRGKMGLLVIDANNTGVLCNDYFFQDIRWSCKGGRADSPAESWNDPRSRRAIFHHMIDANIDFVDRPRIRKHLGTRRFISTSARPSASKAIFDLYKPDSVLDLSMGWGERLLGFEASKYGKTYHGIDPDKRTIEAAHSMHKLCRQSRKGVQLYCSPAEDFIYDALDEQVNLVIFSPPPFNNERYTDEDTQAYKRYQTLDQFINEFLEKTIMKAWGSLKVGGTFLLDLGDLKAPTKDSYGRSTGGRHSMVDPLLRSLLTKLPDVKYRGTIGLGLGSGRSKTSFDRVRVDPIWVLTKGRCELGRRGLFGAKTMKKFAKE